MKQAVSSAQRLSSVDAYRGSVMFLMMAEVLRFCMVSDALPGSVFWRFLCHHQSHVPWVGCSLHDLIQPSFYFLVGVVLPFSIHARRARGQDFAAMARHTASRVIILVGLGMAVSVIRAREEVWTFVDTLSQIGLGYGVVFLLALRPVREQWIALGVILVGYWLAFALYPLPGSDFDYAKVGISESWLGNFGLSGFAAHWQKNSNLAWAFDRWFLNLFPRRVPFVSYGTGLGTLNFLPTIGTMILGVISGGILRTQRNPWAKVRWLAAAGVTALAAGSILGALGVCPVVKAIWTPSWVLFSGGWCFLLLAAFYVLVDMSGKKRFAFPFIVIGVNSITAYCAAHLFQALAFNSFKRVFGREVFMMLGAPYEPVVYGSLVLLFLWSVLFAMYRAGWIVRI